MVSQEKRRFAADDRPHELEDPISVVKRARIQGKTFTPDEVEELLHRRPGAQSRVSCLAEPLQETFTPHDPVHGLIHLPGVVRAVIDTKVFQRLRHIGQLGICRRVYPGAAHDRFFHSIGTAFLGYELMKSLRQRQPELGITDRDVLCVTIAALCHDIGHPCYSHMFEVFMHSLGHDMRRQEEEKAKSAGDTSISAEVEREIQRYEQWSHEDASTRLLEDVVFVEVREQLESAGLRIDDDGDDFACIRELIDPPKKQLENLLERGELRQSWSQHIKGRQVEKAWLYEVVSNWRSSIDVDKFDYFRRDALYLGIHKEFDHDRYMKNARVLKDAYDVPTISPPDKEKDLMRENMLELRKHLHRVAYQHTTVKKLEMHMVDILKLMDPHMMVVGSGGRKLTMSQAAVEFDVVAYQKLTDSLIEARLSESEIPGLEKAAQEYDKRVLCRNLMRLVADWDVERCVTGACSLQADEVLDGVLEEYEKGAAACRPEEPILPVPRHEMRCEVCSFHYGMKFRDPISRILFHSSKDPSVTSNLPDDEAKPMRQKVFCFWNPTGRGSVAEHNLTLRRLTLAFERWANKKAESSGMGEDGLAHLVLSPRRLSKGRSLAAIETEEPSNSQSMTASRPLRSLKIQASCKDDMSDAHWRGLQDHSSAPAVRVLAPDTPGPATPTGAARSPAANSAGPTASKLAVPASVAPRPRRGLKIQASCPVDMEDP